MRTPRRHPLGTLPVPEDVWLLLLYMLLMAVFRDMSDHDTIYGPFGRLSVVQIPVGEGE